MNCWRARQILSAFLDGELSPSEAALVAEHVETCEECGEAMTRIEALPPLDLPRLDRGKEQQLWLRMDEALDQAWDRQQQREGGGVARDAIDTLKRWLRVGRVAIPIPVAAAYLALILGLSGLTLHSHYKIQDLSAALDAGDADVGQVTTARSRAPAPTAFTASVSLPLELAGDRDDEPQEETTPLGYPVYDPTGAIVYTVDHGYPLEY